MCKMCDENNGRNQACPDCTQGHDQSVAKEDDILAVFDAVEDVPPLSFAVNVKRPTKSNLERCKQ